MQIRRDNTQPFFGGRRRKRPIIRLLLIYAALIGGFLFFVDSQFKHLQLMALEVVGQAPPPTEYASDHAQRGYQFYLAGKTSDAVAQFSTAVAQQPDNVEYLYQYGRALIEQGQYDEAVTIGDQAMQLDPNNPRGYAIKAWALDQSITVRNGPEQAIPIGQAGLQVDPNFPPLYAALAYSYTDIDRYDQAVQFGQQGVQLDPSDQLTHRAYAYALIYVGRRDEAIDQLQQAVALNPNVLSPYFELALQYRGASRYEEAIATYERVLALDQTNAKANLRLCQTYLQVGDDRRANNYCEDAVSSDPTYAEAQSELGFVNYKRRNYEGAIETFQKCQPLVQPDQVNSATIRCWYMQGLAEYALGGEHCDAAWTLLQEALPMLDNESIPQYARDTIDSQIRSGLTGVTQRCSRYIGQPLPTDIPPTQIPPTPIGG
jgi:tetratricopeptide (TPR) repeat protein